MLQAYAQAVDFKVGHHFGEGHLHHRLKSGVPLRHEDIEAAVIEGLSTV